MNIESESGTRKPGTISPLFREGEHLSYEVANATFGHPMAAFHPLTIARSIPLSYLNQSMDSATPSDGPRAVGARRVFGYPKLRFAFLKHLSWFALRFA